MTSLSREDMKLAEDAAEWVTRLSLDSSVDDRAELVEWLQRSPRHIEEFLLAQTTYSLFRRLDPQRELDVRAMIADAESSIVPLRQIGPDIEPPVQSVAKESDTTDTSAPPVAVVKQQPARRRLLVAGIAAVGLAVAVVLRIVTGAGTQAYSTNVGEQRTVRLSDGSLIELNSCSKVVVHYSTDVRELKLITGEALFVVAHDARRPFKVFTGAVTIQAVGTQFDVYRGETTTRVAVVEGRIQITPGVIEPAPGKPVDASGTSSSKDVADPTAAAALLVAGEQASVSGDGAVRKSAKPNVSNAIAWRQRRLVFDHTILSEVIGELARYSDYRIELVGEDLRHRHISGVFQADDPQTIVSLLESDPSVSVEHVSNGVIITLKN